MNLAERLTQRLRELPKDRNQTTISEQLGIRFGRLNSWVNGRAEPPLDMIQPLADALDVSPLYLLGISSDSELVAKESGVVRKLPYINDVTLIEPIPAKLQERIEIPAELFGEKRFAVKAWNQFMFPFIWPGDLLVFEPWALGGQVGHIVLCLVGEELTVGISRRNDRGKLCVRKLGEPGGDLITKPLGFLVGLHRITGKELLLRHNPCGITMN